MSALDSLTRDLNWRESEIASMRLLLLSDSVSATQCKVLLRTAWALLYAHYKGFCQNALTTFFDAVQCSGIKCSAPPRPMEVHALGKALRRLKNLQKSGLLSEIESFFGLSGCGKTTSCTFRAGHLTSRCSGRLTRRPFLVPQKRCRLTRRLAQPFGSSPSRGPTSSWQGKRTNGSCAARSASHFLLPARSH